MTKYQFKQPVKPKNTAASFAVARRFFKAFPKEVKLCSNKDVESWGNLHLAPEDKSLWSMVGYSYNKSLAHWFETNADVHLNHSILNAPSGKLYLLCEQLGKGSQGTVWLALDESDYFVAIKVEKQNDEDLGQPNEANVLHDRGMLLEPKFKRVSVIISGDRQRVEETFFTVMPYGGEDLSQFIKNNELLDISDCIRLSVLIFAAYFLLHSGKASKVSRNITYARFDPKPSNILVDANMAVTVIDMATAETDIQGRDSFPLGTRIYMPSEDVLGSIDFWKLDALGAIRSILILQEFRALSGTYFGEDVYDEHKEIFDCEFVLKHLLKPQYSPTAVTAIDSEDNEKLLKVVDTLGVYDLSDEGQLVMADKETRREFPDNILGFGVYLILIEFGYDPYLFDSLDSKDVCKQAIYSLAEVGVYNKELCNAIVSQINAPNVVHMQLIRAIALTQSNLLKSDKFSRILEKERLSQTIINCFKTDDKHLSVFLGKLDCSDYFFETMTQLEKVDKKFISRHLVHCIALQDALVMLRQFDNDIFTAPTIKMLFTRCLVDQANPRVLVHQLITRKLDKLELINMRSEFSMLYAALKILRLAGVYKTNVNKKHLWFTRLSNNADMQVAVLGLGLFSPLATAHHFTLLNESSNPILFMQEKIFSHIFHHVAKYHKLALLPELQHVHRAFIYFGLFYSPKNQQRVFDAWKTIANQIGQSQTGKVTVEPFIDEYTQSLHEVKDEDGDDADNSLQGDASDNDTELSYSFSSDAHLLAKHLNQRQDTGLSLSFLRNI